MDIINDIIKELKTWGISCNVVTEDGVIEYYYADGKFYKEDTSLEDIILNEEQFYKELSHYINVAKSTFINGNVIIFDLTK